jgi:hypothetical protein
VRAAKYELESASLHACSACMVAMQFAVYEVEVSCCDATRLHVQ